MPAVAAAEEAAHHSAAWKSAWPQFRWRLRVIGFLVAYTTYYKKSDRAERVAAQFKRPVHRLC